MGVKADKGTSEVCSCPVLSHSLLQAVVVIRQMNAFAGNFAGAPAAPLNFGASCRNWAGSHKVAMCARE